MILGVLRSDDFAYQLVYLLHIATIVVAFAAAMVNPRLGGLAKRSDEATRRTINRFIVDGSMKMHFPALVLIGLLGIVMVLMSEEVYEFSQLWISLAFLLWFAMMGIVLFLLVPAERRLAVADSESDEKKLAAFGGVMHLLFFLMLIVMVWKPGL